MSYFDFVFVFIRQRALEVKLGLEYKNNISHQKFLIRFKRAAGLIIFHKFRNESVIPETIPEGKLIWFFANTINQYAALKPVYAEMKGHSAYLLFSSNTTMMELTRKESRFIIPSTLKKRYWYRLPLFLMRSFLYSPFFTYKYIDAIVGNFGYSDIFRQAIRAHKPELIVLSHDHLPLYRTLMWTAQKEGVKTVYIQHAAVSAIFPPLSFNFAILDGLYSKEKYEVDKRFLPVVKIFGSAKFDAFYFNRKFKKRLTIIGVCFGLYDNLEKVVEIVRFLSDNFLNLKIYIRPHPADSRCFDVNNRNNNIIISNSRTESTLDYLKKVDVLVSGNSSILLEATAMNILAIYIGWISINEELDDYYEFYKNKVVTKAHDLKELKYRIENDYQIEVYKKAKYYVESIGENYEGNVSGRISKYILSISKSS